VELLLKILDLKIIICGEDLTMNIKKNLIKIFFKDKCDYGLEEVARLEKTKQINAKHQYVSDVMEKSENYWEKRIAIRRMLIYNY
jgi:hypothetical protein